MIPTNSLINQLEAYIRSSAQPLIQLVDTIQEIQQLFTVGEQVRAQVTGELPNGRFAVLVKDQMLDLNLPRNTQAGDQIDMRVIANSPRLAFLMPRQSIDGSTVPQLPTAGTGSAQVALSNTAQFLGDLLTEIAEKGSAQQAAKLPGGQIVMQPGGQLDTASLANTLQKIFSGSGLFYESHLAEWVQGGRDLQSILAEPQAGQGNAAAAANDAKDTAAAQAEAATASRGQGNTTAPAAALARAVGTEAALQAQGQATAPASESSLAAASRGLADSPPVVRDLIQQQLQVMDQRPIVWHGQAWPGQPMRWEVEEDRSQQSGQDEPTQRSWNTRIHLDLPTLGSIDAVINLSDKTHVGVKFTVSRADTAGLIRSESDRLKTQLESAGLELVGQQVAVADEE
ncbi:MAG: flagellar hook-length control protein FliK [Burkholderiales bacterium]|nr:flagellar hook-length control protein FliK [Burkholderiales bacterium]